jgi:hypothetical protein
MRKKKLTQHKHLTSTQGNIQNRIQRNLAYHDRNLYYLKVES